MRAKVYYTTSYVARAVGISQVYLQALIKHGRVPGPSALARGGGPMPDRYLYDEVQLQRIKLMRRRWKKAKR